MRFTRQGGTIRSVRGTLSYRENEGWKTTEHTENPEGQKLVAKLLGKMAPPSK